MLANLSLKQLWVTPQRREVVTCGRLLCAEQTTDNHRSCTRLRMVEIIPPVRTLIKSNEEGIKYHEKRHHKKIIRINATAANGAYCRIMACMLMFLAALRYLSDSVRREVERCDIPT